MATSKENINAQSSEFDEYRRKMHHADEGETRSVIPAPHHGVRMAFGVFMILLYVGMGFALFLNAFHWDASFTWVRWVVGVVLVIYGIFRGYRQFTGSDYYGK